MVACGRQFRRSILALVVLLVQWQASVCFAPHRNSPLYGGSGVQLTFKQASLHVAAKTPAVRSFAARKLQPLQAWSFSWLADKAKELIQPPRILQKLAKHLPFKKRVPLKPVPRQSTPKVDTTHTARTAAIAASALSRKPLYEALIGVDLEQIAFPITTEYPPLLQAVLDFHPPYMLPTKLRIAKTDQIEDRLTQSLIKCFMVSDMKQFAVPFDEKYYDDWVFTVPPEGVASTTEKRKAASPNAISEPSLSETVAAIGEPTPAEAKLLDKKGISTTQKVKHWKQYVDRAVKEKAVSFQSQLQDKALFNQSVYDELQYYQLNHGLFQSMEHWSKFQNTVIHRILGSRSYDLSALPGVMFTLATRYNLPLEVVVTLKQADTLFQNVHIDWSVDQTVAFLHSFRTCLSKQYMTTMLEHAKDRVLRTIPHMNTQDLVLSLLGVSRAAMSEHPAVSTILRELLARIPDEHLKWTFNDIILALKALTSEPRLKKYVASVGERLLLTSPTQLLSSNTPASATPSRAKLAPNQTVILDILARQHNNTEVNVLLGQIEGSLDRSEDIFQGLIKRNAATAAKNSAHSAPTIQRQDTGSYQFVSRLLELVSHLYREEHSLGTDEFLFDVARKLSKVTAEEPCDLDINELVGVGFGFRNRSNLPALAMDRAAIRRVVALRKLSALPLGEDVLRAAVFQFEGISAFMSVLTEATLRSKGNLLPSVLRRAVQDFGRMDLAIDNNLRALLISWTVRMLTSDVVPTDEEAIALTNQVAQSISKDVKTENTDENTIADFRFWTSTLRQKFQQSKIRPDVASRCVDLLEGLDKQGEDALAALPKNIYST